MDKKTVNIYANYCNPILNNQLGYIMNISLSLNDIKDIILKGNDVTEILPNGTVVRLTMENYNIDFSKDGPNKKDVVVNDKIDFNTVGKDPIKKETVEVKEEPVKEQKSSNFIVDEKEEVIEDEVKVEEEVTEEVVVEEDEVKETETAEEEVVEEKTDLKKIQNDYKRNKKR